MSRKKSKIKKNNDNKSLAIDKWKALITSFLMQSLVLGTMESYGALYVPIMETYFFDYAGRNSISAMIGSLTTGCLMGFSPMSSFLIDKAGPQIIALFGGIIVFIATLLTSFVRTFFLMAFLYGVMFGIGASLLFMSSNVVISRYFEENSTMAYGILGLGNGLMNSIMPHVISYSVANITIAGTIRIISLLLSCIMFFPLYWNKDNAAEREDNPVLGYIPTRILFKKHANFQLYQDDRLTPISRMGSGGATTSQDTHNNAFFLQGSAGNNKFQNPTIINPVSQAVEPSAALVQPRLVQRGEDLRDHMQHTSSSIIRTSSNAGFTNENPSYNSGISSLFRKLSPVQAPFSTNSSIEEPDTTGLRHRLFMSMSTLGGRHSQPISDSNLTDQSASTRNATITVARSLSQCCTGIEVFSSQPYVMLIIAMPIAMLGYQVPNVHIVNYANVLMPEKNGQLLLTCLGGAAAVGPFVTGIILDRFSNKITKYRVYQMLIIMYGIVVLTLSLLPSYTILIIICLIIGFIDGSFSSLIGPLAIDLVGVHKAGQAIGIFYGSIATSVTVAPPLAGLLYDVTDTYKYSFFMAGLCFIVGGLLLSFSHTKIGFNKTTDLSIAFANQLYSDRISTGHNSDSIDTHRTLSSVSMATNPARFRDSLQ